jgi:hypothetical protein
MAQPDGRPVQSRAGTESDHFTSNPRGLRGRDEESHPCDG